MREGEKILINVKESKKLKIEMWRFRKIIKIYSTFRVVFALSANKINFKVNRRGKKYKNVHEFYFNVLKFYIFS